MAVSPNRAPFHTMGMSGNRGTVRGTVCDEKAMLRLPEDGISAAGQAFRACFWIGLQGR